MAESMEDCVMLALSTFRKSEQAIDEAIQKAKSPRKLLIVFVADIDLARYFIGAEDGLTLDLKDACEADLLELHIKEGCHHVEKIAARAGKEDIEVKSFVNAGMFASVCLDFVKEVKPSLIVTTRSRRPEWVKRFFGAPVDELIEKAGCPVLVV